MTKSRIKKKPEKAIREIERIGKNLKGKEGQVLVGLPKGSNDYPDGTSVIMVGTVHEFGSPSRNIPQRSFLRSTMIENSREYKELIAKLAKRISKGELTMDRALNLLGIKVQGDVQQKIHDIKTPPLKYREGNPLIDTGHLRQSITYVVRKK